MKRIKWVGFCNVIASWLLIGILIWAIITILKGTEPTKARGEGIQPIAEQGKPQLKNLTFDEINDNVDWSSVGENQFTLTHQQEVWRYALEWCESQGKKGALNPKDLDGTPSHSYFQFKWDTLRFYASRYEMVTNTLSKAQYIELASNWDLISEVVSRMIGDKSVDWSKQFPGCVRKNGWPPGAKSLPLLKLVESTSTQK